ncbi:GntR family transcriptional regulator [Nonomuraea jiangxiensis]|uniref:GntR family transcriptional regulator/GntR family transcriptional regulator, frlABCD operon transcriptional regulator n=1 Tax=Nonomuraea jiangxiensis TaxID=633440 RepID=A0A1G9PIW8_9ACTN|nr:GntR family transcriptional regulator [Nonomuraea jiangxiensis]SDL98748.1 GntR family transcriptional regulator/GntR family transcriptional regulator, frlABCD operon transcriptional regulator [Nonomuraea jiangxiensis]
MRPPEQSPSELPAGIDRGSPVPYHEQIYRLLLDMILSGRLAPGQKLMQEKEYALRLGVSLAPVRQAILALVKDGYLTRTRGRGTYVKEPKVGTEIQLLTSFTDTLNATGLPTAMRVLAVETVPAAEPVSTKLGVPDGAELLRLRRLAYLAGEPVVLLTAWLPASPYPGLADTDLSGSLYHLLEERYGTVMTSAHNIIEVVRALPEHATHLQVPVGEALLRVEAVTRDQHGTPVEFSQVLYQADRFRFEIESHPQHGAGIQPTPRTSPEGTIR